MRLCDDYYKTQANYSAAGCTLRDTKNNVARWRKAVSASQDGAGVDTAVAFAEAGWNGNWDAITGLSIPGAVPNNNQFTFQLQWTAGCTFIPVANVLVWPIIDFLQGSTWDSYCNSITP
jgi:hypothetical protein